MRRAEAGDFSSATSLFSRTRSASSRSNGAQVFVNISNDGWYGDSGAYAQHLNQTRMRAVENERWILSATDTGVTASIDPYGRVAARLPRKNELRWSRLTPSLPSPRSTRATETGSRMAVCDNFDRSAADALRILRTSAKRLKRPHESRVRAGIREAEQESPRSPGVSLTRTSSVRS